MRGVQKVHGKVLPNCYFHGKFMLSVLVVNLYIVNICTIFESNRMKVKHYITCVSRVTTVKPAQHRNDVMLYTSFQLFASS